MTKSDVMSIRSFYKYDYTFSETRIVLKFSKVDIDKTLYTTLSCAKSTNINRVGEIKKIRF